MSEAMTVDTAPVPAGVNEELAGPPHGVAPVVRAERLASVDTLRGFALLGILLMNITSFGLPDWDYAVPLSTPLPVFSGPHAKINTVVWFLRWILAEGKMRGLFSMLFGAGVILLTERAVKRGAGIFAADIYTRRNMWLVLFGMLHAYFIWYGDILYWYGVTGLLFLFPFRNLRAKTLLWPAAVVIVLNGSLLGGGQYFGAVHAKAQADKANAQLREGKKPLSEEQVQELKDWKKAQDDWRPSEKRLDEDLAATRKGYWSAQGREVKNVFQSETEFYYAGFGDVLGFMLLGMALYRNGFLTARLSNRSYAIIAVVGLGIAWPLTYEGCIHAYRSHFDLFVSMRWLQIPYEIGRVGGALGNAAVLLLIFKSGALRWLMRSLAAVGQMAISNYLLTSFSMRMLFVWGPLKWYGRLEYYQLYLVLACVWIVNLTWSPIWLRYFQFGPMEWVWRSLTYWKRQPMWLRSKAAAAVAAAASA